jgi:hypothetical protein
MKRKKRNGSIKYFILRINTINKNSQNGAIKSQ